MSQETVPQQMRAVVVHGPEDYRLETRPVPQVGETDLLIQVDAVGVCASDLKCYHGAAKFWGDENRPQWAENNRIMGHELTGTIVAGSEKALARHSEGKFYDLAVGDAIVVEQIAPCGKCRYCQNGQYWMCGPHDMFGFKGWDGAMADYMLVPELARVHRISKDVPPAHRAFAEPLSCALHAVERGNLQFGDVVVIAGAGPIGLSALIGARQKNPLKIVVLDMAEDKLALARELGADETINIRETDAVQTIKDMTDGYGADVYIECTGHPSAVPQGLNLLRKLGTYVEYSVFGSDVTVDWSIISDDKELDVLGAHLGPYTWPAAVKIIESGILPLEKICTNQFPLDQFQDALDMVADSQGDSIKVSVLPQSTEPATSK